VNLTQTVFSGLPDQIRTTLSIGNEMIAFWSGNVFLIQLAREIVSGIHDPVEVCEAVRSWVRGSVEYRSDPADYEMLQDPIVTLQTRAGDCDDMAVLAGALLACVGHQCEVLSVTWAGNEDPSHAVAYSWTSGSIVDPVSWVHVAEWPPENRTVLRLGRA